MNRIKVLFFATLRDRAGTKMLELEIPAAMSVGELKKHLGRAHPKLRHSLETALIAVNREYAFDEDLVPANAEVAMFPPVSGG